MGNYATAADVAARWPGYIAEDHQDFAEVLIGDAESLIADEYPGLDARIADGKLSERTVTQVVVAMVVRVLKNPSGFRREQDGDYEYQYAPSAVIPGEVALTAGDRAKLAGNRRATTIGPNDPALKNPWRYPEYELVQDWGEDWRYH